MNKVKKKSREFLEKNKLIIPNEGYVGDLETIITWYTKKGNIVKKDSKYGTATKELPVSIQNSVRRSLWHTSILTENKKRLLSNSILTVKLGAFDRANLAKVRNILDPLGLDIVLVPPKMVNSGGISKLLISDRQIVKEIAKEMGIDKNLYNLPTSKRIGYLSLLLAENIKFKSIPKVKILPGDTNGRAWISSKLARENDITEVCKLGGVSKDVAIINDTITDLYDADIVMSEGGDKFNLEDPEKIAGLIGHRPKCHPLVSFNKGLPTFRWDIMIMQEWDCDVDLSKERRYIETGIIDPLYIYENMSYEKDGVRDIINKLKPLMLGGSLYHHNRSEIVLKSLKTAICKKFWRNSPGLYGTLCDIRECPDNVSTKEVIAYMYPNQRPIKTVAKIWWEAGMIGIPNDIIEKEGRDLDGDGIVIVPRDIIDWSIDPYDNPLVLPEKGTGETCETMDDHDVWSEMVETISKVGSVHNDSVIINSVSMHNGINDKEKANLVNEMLYMDETYIHGFKHGFNENTPDIAERIKDKDLDNKDIIRESKFSKLIKSKSILDIINEAGDAREDGPFFEKVTSKFKGWNIGNDPVIDKNLADMLKEIHKKSLRDMWVTRYGSWQNEYTNSDYELRWKISKQLLKDKGELNMDTVKKFIIVAFNSKQYSWANFLYDKWWNNSREALMVRAIIALKSLKREMRRKK